jgi:hypothetical protein
MKKRKLKITRDRVKRLQGTAGGVTATSTLTDTIVPTVGAECQAGDPQPRRKSPPPTFETFKRSFEDTLRTTFPTAIGCQHGGGGGGGKGPPTRALTAVACHG